MVLKICLCSPLFGEDSHFDYYFSKGVETTNKLYISSEKTSWILLGFPSGLWCQSCTLARSNWSRTWKTSWCMWLGGIFDGSDEQISNETSNGCLGYIINPLYTIYTGYPLSEIHKRWSFTDWDPMGLIHHHEKTPFGNIFLELFPTTLKKNKNAYHHPSVIWELDSRCSPSQYWATCFLFHWKWMNFEGSLCPKFWNVPHMSDEKALVVQGILGRLGWLATIIPYRWILWVSGIFLAHPRQGGPLLQW